MKKRYRTILQISGWISLLANLVAIAGFLIDRWPLAGERANPGFWVVLSFLTSAYALVIWSTWVWQRSARKQPGVERHRSGVFLLNAMAALPVLTAWLQLLLATAADGSLTVTLRWVLALAIAWAVTPFVALGLSWSGATIGALLEAGD